MRLKEDALFAKRRLSEAAVYTVVGLFVDRALEYVGGIAVFDRAAAREKCGPVRNSARLLHIVRDDNDSVLFAQRYGKLLNALRRYRVERAVPLSPEQPAKRAAAQIIAAMDDMIFLNFISFFPFGF